MRRGRLDGAQGFTLLEILVSLAILAALLAGLAQGVHFGITAWNAQIQTIARNEDLDRVDRTLRTLLTGAIPAGTGDQANLQGGPHRLVFPTRMPAGAPTRWTRRALVTLQLDKQTLVLDWSEQPHAALLAAAPPTHEEPLLSGVATLQFSYLGSDGTWNDQWSQAVLPELVRVQLGFDKKDPRRWPDLLIAPRRDPASGGGDG